MKSLTVCPHSVLAGVCGVGPVPADPEEAAAEGLQRRLSPLPPNPEHPRLPGREGMYDGPHRVYEPNALHCTTGNTHVWVQRLSLTGLCFMLLLLSVPTFSMNE